MAKGIFNLKQANQAIRQDAWTAFHPPKFVEYLIVGGGGGGGGANGSSGQGGGGGAGGLLSGIVPVTTGTSYTITVGSGGSGSAVPATSGTSSVFNYVTAFGGGGGGNYNSKPGLSGGSGGGAGGDSANTGVSLGGEAIFGQGHKGGSSIQAGASADGTVAGGGGSEAGGGGGAGTVGTDSVFTYSSASGLGGTGGSGLASAITGIPVIYAGGGGGSSRGTGGLGGVGGGGLGGTGGTAGVHGSFGFGGGGGGHFNANSTAGNGGTGVVIIRYPGTTQFYTGGTLSYGNGHVIHTFYATGTLAPTTPTTYVNADYQISRSIRLNKPDLAFFERTVGGGGNRKTWTWSGWVKRTAINTSNIETPAIFLATDQSTGTGKFVFGSYGSVSDSLVWNDSNGTTDGVETSAVFRDLSAWYHIVLAHDSTQANSTDRVKIYVNGTLQALTAGSTYPVQNKDTYINYSSFPHRIGAYNGAGSGYQLNAYLAEVNFIDGQQLTPSSFGWINPATGVWAPIKFVGTYGTNGFYVNFSDNSNITAATLGADSSGNGNNWTPTNFSVTAGAGNDSLVDTPTLYGTDTGVGGEVRGNYATWNPLAKGGSFTNAPTNGNLDIISATTPNYGTALATMGMISGKWYWEVTNNAGTAAQSIGLAKDGVNLDSFLGSNTFGWTYLITGQTQTNGTGASYGASYTTNDIIGVAFDADAGTLVFYKNGTSQGTAFSGLTSGYYYPAVGDDSGANQASYTINFGQRPFAYTAPSGFKALCTTNLPTPTVGATAATLASKYFSAITYSGNAEASSNDTQNIATPFYPDLVWVKGRSGGDSTFYHRLTSTGLTQPNYLSTNSDDGEQSLNDQISALANTHFQVKAAGGGGTNQRGSTYVAWAWNAGNGTLVTNTSGSVTTQVSANPTSGFSIATFTLPATGGNPTFFTWGHGLGVAPSMIIYKTRTTFVNNWLVYHASLGNTGALILNSTGAVSVSSGYFNNTSPTSTVATVNIAVIGPNSDNAVAYSFAEIAGYSKFGSYTGNGSTDGPFVFTGFRPAFLMIKRTNAVSNAWMIYDGTRNTSNLTNKKLGANLADEENSGAQMGGDGLGIDFLSNGFKSVTQTTTNQNASGGSYIFAAFASTPFKYSLAR